MVLVSGHSQGGGGNKDSGREGRGHPGAEILKQTRWPVTGVTRGTSHHQFIVRLIDGADMSLSPGKHWARADHNAGITGNYFNNYTIRQQSLYSPGLPLTSDTVVSSSDAANIVQELFVCAAFRTNKSFGRSLAASPSEQLFESMNYILRLL